MTAKQFFKGTAFKCLAVLTAILLISGILLSVCWGFMEVTDDERFQRKLAVVYPNETILAEDIESVPVESDATYGTTTIKKCWFISSKNDYIVESKSKGYNGGITCWVTITMTSGKNSEIAGIRSVQIYKADAADELVGNIKDYVYKKFSEDYTPDVYYEYGTKGTEQYIDVGASHTLTAVCNCVNASLSYIKGEKDPYASFEFNDKIDIRSSSWTPNGTEVNYTLVTAENAPAEKFTINITVNSVSSEIVITNYEVVVDGSTSETYSEKVFTNYENYSLSQITALILGGTSIITGGVIPSGATSSNEHCLYAAAFALANYPACLVSAKGAN